MLVCQEELRARRVAGGRDGLTDALYIIGIGALPRGVVDERLLRGGASSFLLGVAAPSFSCLDTGKRRRKESQAPNRGRGSLPGAPRDVGQVYRECQGVPAKFAGYASIDDARAPSGTSHYNPSTTQHPNNSTSQSDGDLDREAVEGCDDAFVVSVAGGAGTAEDGVTVTAQALGEGVDRLATADA